MKLIKNLRWLLLFLVIFGCHSSTSLLQRADLHWTPTQPPLVSVHRGGPMEGFPENCLATFENTLTYGNCLLECDVQMTQDSVLILIHDDELDRTTTSTGNVNETSLAEIKSLHLKDNTGNVTSYQIPTLAEALIWTHQKTILQLDIKRSVSPAKVVEVVMANQAEDEVVIITYSPEMALIYHRLNPNLMLSVSAKDKTQITTLLETGIPPQNLMVFVGLSIPEVGVYKMLHQYGICPVQGTMGTIDEQAQNEGVEVYLDLLRRGASVLAVDDFPLALEAVQLYQQH